MLDLYSWRAKGVVVWAVGPTRQAVVVMYAGEHGDHRSGKHFPKDDPGKTNYGEKIYHNKRGVQYVKAEELAQNEHIQKLFKDAAKAFKELNKRVDKDDC